MSLFLLLQRGFLGLTLLALHGAHRLLAMGLLEVVRTLQGCALIVRLFGLFVRRMIIVHGAVHGKRIVVTVVLGGKGCHGVQQGIS